MSDPISLPSHHAPNNDDPLALDDNDDRPSPRLEFVNLAGRRGSLKPVSDPQLLADRRGSSGLWTGGYEVDPNRRGSIAGSGSKRGEMGWGKTPPSPSGSRRPSLAASLLSRDLPSSHSAASGSSSAGSSSSHHHRGRRPSSSSSAQSSSTIRPHGVNGSPPTPGGLLPFGHSFKNSANGRRSSLTPQHAAPLSHTTPIHAVSSTSTATSPTKELNSYRFGSTTTSQQFSPASPASVLNRRLSYEPTTLEEPEEYDNNDADADRARERFKAHLMRAGLTSMSIQLPPPGQTTFQPHASTSASSHFSSPAQTPDALTPTTVSASDSYRFTFPTTAFVPSPRSRTFNSPRRRRTSSDTDEDGDREDEPESPGGGRNRRRGSNFLDARRMSLDHRKELNVDDEGSGIDDETDTDESETKSRRQSSDSPNHGGLLTFRNPFSEPNPPPDLVLPSTPELDQRRSSSPLQPSPSLLFVPSETSGATSASSSAGTSTTIQPSQQQNLARRPSISPWLADDDGMPTINMSTARVTTSPPRSLSDSAVPRRPSLAQEVGADLPEVGSGAASVSGHEAMEWDMDFVLGGGGGGNGVDFQSLSEDAHPGSYQNPWDYPASTNMQASSSAGAGHVDGVDSFALFVQNNDSLYDKHRLAWTLSRSFVPTQGTTWTLPTTGGYTYIAPFGTDSSAPTSTTSSFSSVASSFNSRASSSRPPDSSLPGAGGVSFSPPAPGGAAFPTIRGNRPPCPGWALKQRGKGWGIIPLQGSRTEIKFGPKGKWRTTEPMSTGSGRGSGRGMHVRQSSSKDRRSIGSKTSGKGHQQSSSADKGARKNGIESIEDRRPGSPLGKSLDSSKVAWREEYSTQGGLGISASDPFSRARADAIPIQPHASPPPSPKGRSAPVTTLVERPESAVRHGSGARGQSAVEKEKSKRKSGWLSSLKNAGAVLSGKEPSSAAMSSRTSSLSGSGSGHDDPRIGSPEKTTGSYVPPWMTGAAGKEKEKESGFKMRFKRRSISDGVRRMSKEKDKSLSGDEDGPGSSTFGSTRRQLGPPSTDDETDDGEAREGKAWEDVPTEALAMVIPLSIPQSPSARRYHGSTSTTGTFPSIASSNSSEFAAGKWSPNVSPEVGFTVDPASPTGQPAELAPLPPVEISLLVYFVPFGESVTSPTQSTHSAADLATTPTGPGWRFNKKLKKTQSQLFRSKEKGQPSPTSPTSFNHSQLHPPRPSLHQTAVSASSQSTSSDSTPTTTSSSHASSSYGFVPTASSPTSPNAPTPPPRAHFAPFPCSQPGQPSPFSAFRIVARAVDPSDLTFLPSWPSWESQPASNGGQLATEMMLSEPGTNPETKAKETKDGRTDPTVVGVCHGPETGVEFVREGWERLGFVQPLGDGDGGGGGTLQVEQSSLVYGGSKADKGEISGGLEDVLGCLVAACVAVMGGDH